MESPEQNDRTSFKPEQIERTSINSLVPYGSTIFFFFFGLDGLKVARLTNRTQYGE